MRRRALYKKKNSGEPLYTYYTFNGSTTESVRGANPIGGSTGYNTGVNGQAAEFDGSNYLHLPVGLFDDTADGFSMAVWLKATSTARGRILELNAEPQAVYIELNDGGTAGRLRVSVAGVNGEYVTDAIDIMQWFHVFITVPKNGERKFYINGGLVNSGTDVWKAGTASPYNNIIGAARNQSIKAQGLMDGLGFYDFALTSEQVQSEYQRHLTGELI